MGAGFKRHIDRGAARQVAGLRQRLGLGMGAPPGPGPAAPDDPAMGNDDAAHGGIGPYRPQTPRPERQGMGHVPGIVCRGHSLSVSGGRSSLTKSSKSSAAWKFL